VRARRRIADLAASGLPPEPLAARLMAAVAEAVPHDGFRLFGVDPQTLLVNRLLAASQEDGWARLEWLQEVYLAAGPLGYIELPNLMRAGLPAVAFQDRQELCWGLPPDLLAAVTPRAHHDRFHEIRSPVGGTLLAGFAAGGRWMAALQAYRRDPDRPFRAGEVAFVRGISQAAGLALAASLARERALLVDGDRESSSRAVGQHDDGSSPTPPTASGILLLEPGGRVRFATPAGETWRGLLADADRSGRTQGNGADELPTAVWSAVAALRAGAAVRADWAAGSGDGETARRRDEETGSRGEVVDQPGALGGAGVVLASSTYGPVRVEASAAGEDGATAIVLAPARPPEPPAVPPDWPLTPGERETVARLLRGAGNRQIAGDLCVSEHTVEWRLRHAYEKLGVHSRTELLARFFQEAFLPGMRGEG